MKGRIETCFYVSVAVGMALATSSFTMVGNLFSASSALWILMGIAISGAFCMVIALSIGELASMFPSAPGIRTYFKIAFGNRVSLILVYLYLIFVVLIAGLESFVFSQVGRAVFPNSIAIVTVIGLIGVVVAINLVGWQLPRNVQILTTVFAVLLIVISGTWGLLNAKLSLGEVLSPGKAVHGASLLPALAGMSVFLYTGFEWVTPLGIRPKAYERKIPFSMPAGVFALFVAYSLFVLGAASQLRPEVIAATATPQLPYFVALYGDTGKYLALLLSVLAISSTFNAGILGGSQLIYMLAQEGKMPAYCASLSLRTGCPKGAILVLGALAAIAGVFMVTFRVELLVGLIGASIMCLIYATFVIAVIKLRKDRPDTRRPFRTPVFQGVQWALAAILTVMGIQTLFSGSSFSLSSSLGLLGCLAVAFALRHRRALSAPLRTEK